jgi:hypothetical protein
MKPSVRRPYSFTLYFIASAPMKKAKKKIVPKNFGQMSKRTRAEAALDKGGETQAVPEQFETKNPLKRFKAPKAPACAFEASGKCQRSDVVFMELACAQRHHACGHCLVSNLQAGLRFADTHDNDGQAIRTLSTSFFCPACTLPNEPQEIFPRADSLIQLHPHVSAVCMKLLVLIVWVFFSFGTCPAYKSVRRQEAAYLQHVRVYRQRAQPVPPPRVLQGLPDPVPRMFSTSGTGPHRTSCSDVCRQTPVQGSTVCSDQPFTLARSQWRISPRFSVPGSRRMAQQTRALPVMLPRPRCRCLLQFPQLVQLRRLQLLEFINHSLATTTPGDWMLFANTAAVKLDAIRKVFLISTWRGLNPF